MKDKVVELKVEGMTCNNCAAGLNRFLKKKGMDDVYVNYATNEVRYTPGENSASLTEVKESIHKMGYQVTETLDHAHDGHNHSETNWSIKKKMWFCAIFTLPLLLQHVFMMLGVTSFGLLDNYWFQFALALPVFIVGCLHFGKSAWSSIKMGVPNMDVLIFIGSTAAFIYSIVGTILDEHNYIFYETSATIITLVLLGNYLEHRSVAQTTTAIEELGKLKVQTARKLTSSGSADKSGKLQEVEVQQVQINDILQVNEGDAVPLDGVIIEGQGAIDESMLSGESIPLEKKEGDEVFGGSLLASGNMKLKVTAIGQDTVLSKMIQLVKDAQQEKPDIQRLADKISAVFVPVVLVIAALTLTISYFFFNVPFSNALMNSIAVLVISCPCAMGLATPTAVMVGVGRVARNGILIRGGQTLELFAAVKKMVFDKTGTLTTGNFEIEKINYLDGQPEEIDAIIYAMEHYSSHPIAASLVNVLSKKPVIYQYDFEAVKEIKGRGVVAKDKRGNQYKIGSFEIAKHLTQDDSHSIYLVKNDKLIATIDIQDDIKEGAVEMIQKIKSDGIEPILLSGDKKEKVAAVAKQLNIASYHGEQPPEEKLQRIEQLSNNEITAMVGDGINDAPALAKATVGVSLSDASQAAIQSAQIVLLNGKLENLSKAVTISRATLKTIKQNLFWAFAYNIVAIPIAALGFLNPMWGALFMAFSDVMVIGNSLRLKTRKL